MANYRVDYDQKFDKSRFADKEDFQDHVDSMAHQAKHTSKWANSSSGADGKPVSAAEKVSRHTQAAAAHYDAQVGHETLGNSSKAKFHAGKYEKHTARAAKHNAKQTSEMKNCLDALHACLES